MKVLITGVCGFVGSQLAAGLVEHGLGSGSLEVVGLDNLSRPGSHTNIPPLQKLGVRLIHGDVRMTEDLAQLPHVDWVIDAAANPSVAAGIDGQSSSRQLVSNNLVGTLNLLETCRCHRAGFVLLSSSRVYSIHTLKGLPIRERAGAFHLDPDAATRDGVSSRGISETFPTTPPVSLYGASKLASETLALEYGSAFDLPVWINRCGVLAGAGQFGRADQGIFSFWINSYLRHRRLSYIGFNGSGLQTRDCLHPRDLVPLLIAQMTIAAETSRPRTYNFGGGPDNAMSLRQLSEWCADRYGPRPIGTIEEPRVFDVPWVVMDSSLATEYWDWKPLTPLERILDEIAAHGEANEDWLDVSAPL
jgi:CDP-paratose 2-epimerase